MLSQIAKQGKAIVSPLPQGKVAARFTIALATAVLAIVLRALLDPVLGHVAFYATVYMSVAFCAILCGLIPAMLTAAIGFAGIFYWFVDPRHSFVVARSSELHGIAGFILVSIVLILLGEANRRKQLKLNDTIEALTKEAHERMRAEDELRQAHDELEQRVKDRTENLQQALADLQSEIAMRKKTEMELRRLSVRLMTLQDEERRRIARELHDNVGQTLVAMKMSVATIRTHASDAGRHALLLDDLNDLIDAALNDVRATSHLLHPPLLEEVGFASAAKWFVEGFAKRSSIKVTCDVPERFDRPPRECELVLFRVLQESLTNVYRHSGASAVNVRLYDSDFLTLEIQDNGGGIPKERLYRLRQASGASGVGTAGMRERVRQMAGHFDIMSDSTGTTVCVRIPRNRVALSDENLRASTV